MNTPAKPPPEPNADHRMQIERLIANWTYAASVNLRMYGEDNLAAKTFDICVEDLRGVLRNLLIDEYAGVQLPPGDYQTTCPEKANPTNRVTAEVKTVKH